MAILDAVPVEQIRADARQVRFSRVLITVIAGFFFAIGWTAGHTWLAVVFCAVAIRYGWREGTGIPRDASQAARE